MGIREAPWERLPAAKALNGLFQAKARADFAAGSRSRERISSRVGAWFGSYFGSMRRMCRAAASQEPIRPSSTPVPTISRLSRTSSDRTENELP